MAAKKEEERLTSQLKLITEEKNRLSDRLIYVMERDVEKRPYNKPNPLYEKLKLKEKEFMYFMRKLELEKTEARENFQECKKDFNFYSHLQRQLLKNRTMLIKNVATLNLEKKVVLPDYALLQKYMVDLNLSGKVEQEKTSSLQTQQHQVSETARDRQLDTAQEESSRKIEMLPQESPAENHPEMA